MLTEIAKKWKNKKNGIVEAPMLMLTDGSGSSSSNDDSMEKLMDGLFAMQIPQLKASLEAYNLPVSGDKDTLVQRLALFLLA